MRALAQRWTHATTALALACIGAACVPVFEHPLPAGAELKPDPALIGTWSGLDVENGGSQLSVFPRQDGWVDLLFVTDLDGTSASGADLDRYEGYTTMVGAEHLLSFRERGGATNLYMLARYRIEPPARLSIQVFEQEALRALVEAGKLPGQIEAHAHMDSITVTAAPAQLVAAIVAEGVGAFVSTNLDLRFARMGVLPQE